MSSHEDIGFYIPIVVCRMPNIYDLVIYCFNETRVNKASVTTGKKGNTILTLLVRKKWL